MEFGLTKESLRVHTIIKARTGTTISDLSNCPVECPGSDRSKRAVSIRRAFRHNVDDAINGVRSPDRATRAADHFDPIDIFKNEILHVPKHAGEERRVNNSSVNQDQNRFREIALRT